uniref:GOLD domain-containing protein n=1 Tax=Macrostomum lignano TaxID=282301 RepID=A0A1I8IF92_9PLAT
MTYVWTQQLTCFLLLLSLSGPRAVFSSTVEVFEDEKTKELSISVESSRPETTFSGRIGIRNTFGYFYRLHQDFAAKEEFCFFTVALGMRNFSCHAFATKYWDLDTEIEVSNSEGDVLRTGKLGDQGKAKITEAASRINARLAEVISDIESSYSNIAQDVYRLLNIRKWVNARGALGSIAMLCCTGLSTFIIRRWFGSPRTSI